jgi:hypothetical protein
MASYYPTEYLELNISRGLVKGTDLISKFGYSSSVGSDYETVWDGANSYVYITTAGTAAVTSSQADDSDGTVLVQGLDANYNEVQETLTIGGSAGQQLFYRVFRAQMVTANTGETNTGNVDITVDSKVAARITEDEGQTLMSLYTIPAGKKGYLTQLDVGSSKDVENTIKVVTRLDSAKPWNTKSYITTRGGFLEKNYKLPLEFPEKTDIEVRAKASATSAISAGFELVIIEDKLGA